MKKNIKKTICTALTMVLLVGFNSYASSGGNLDLETSAEKSITVCFEEIDDKNSNETEIESLRRPVFKESGKISWYWAAGNQGESGEILSSNSAAHKTLPFWTNVTVTSDENGKSTNVVILDRGTFSPGVILDVDRTAFSKMHDPSKGLFWGTIRWL